MTSTFPTSRSNSHNLRYSIKQLQHKKEALINLEAALKKRINEFRELCLKEGELTGHLPADYPLQPREPIPQVRRRITRSNGKISHLREPEIQPIRPARTYQSTRMADPSKIHFPPPIEKQGSESNINGLYGNGYVLDKRQPVNTSTEALTNFQHLRKELDAFHTYHEESKPFKMSDFYKYSAKHRQNVNPTERSVSIDNVFVDNQSKSTRQLQDEIARMKNPLKFADCDNQIQASQKLIEKNDQTLMRATARAIAVNPSIAEKLSSIAFNNNNNGTRY